MTWHEAIGLVAVVFLVFAFVHSLCVTMNVKLLMARRFGESFVRGFYRLLYNSFSFITTGLAVYAISLIPDYTLWKAPAWLYWPMRGVQATGLFIGIRALGIFDALEFMGVRQAWRYVRNKPVLGDMEGIRINRLVTSGVYGVVRNPMYLAGIMIFTFSPVITRNWLAVSVLADAYFLYGSLIEQKRMLSRFGEEYRGYASEVPLLIPTARSLKRLFEKQGKA